MAYSYTLKDRISWGNKKLWIYDLTDVQDSTGSDLFPGCDTVLAVKAVNNTDTADTFKEAVGADSAPSTRNKVTFVAATADDDGHAWVWGN